MKTQVKSKAEKDIRTRTRGVLWRAKIIESPHIPRSIDIAKLFSMTDDDLRSLKGCGEKVFEDIKKFRDELKSILQL